MSDFCHLALLNSYHLSVAAIRRPAKRPGWPPARFTAILIFHEIPRSLRCPRNARHARRWWQSEMSDLDDVPDFEIPLAQSDNREAPERFWESLEEVAGEG